MAALQSVTPTEAQDASFRAFDRAVCEGPLSLWLRPVTDSNGVRSTPKAVSSQLHKKHSIHADPNVYTEALDASCEGLSNPTYSPDPRDVVGAIRSNGRVG